MLNSKQVLSRLTYPITFTYSSYLNVLLIVLRPGKNYSSNSIETFKQELREVNWNEVKQSNNANKSYAKFSEICTSLYEECFPKFKIRLNQRKNLSPWITKGIKKSSKRKQKLYEKFLKKRNAFNETAYKTYKNLFEAVKRKSKKKSLLTKDTPIQT